MHQTQYQIQNSIRKRL